MQIVLSAKFHAKQTKFEQVCEKVTKTLKKH